MVGLGGADLGGAILKAADPRETHLEEAKNLTAEQVRSAKNWHKAYLPDSLKYLKDLPDPSACPCVLRLIKLYYVELERVGPCSAGG